MVHVGGTDSRSGALLIVTGPGGHMRAQVRGQKCHSWSLPLPWTQSESAPDTWQSPLSPEPWPPRGKRIQRCSSAAHARTRGVNVPAALWVNTDPEQSRP